jgi:hypothetical protein
MIDFIKFHCQSYIASPSIEHWILSFIWLWWWCPHMINCCLIKWVVVFWVAPSFLNFSPLVLTGESYWLQISGVEWLLNSFTGNIRKTLWQRWSRSSSDRAETAWLSQCDRAC